jgi:hypothetical protein
MSEKLAKPSTQSEVLTQGAFYNSPLGYLKTMFIIAWAAFAHPFSSTVIDLTTGNVRHDTDEDGK